VAIKAFPDAKIIGRAYTDDRPLPEFQKGDRIIIVDFSFPAARMEAWAAQSIVVMVIDHHKTALENLSGLSDRVIQHFDMNECGATLAWKTLFPEKPMPAFLEFVRSRDLWLDCDLFSDPIPETVVVHEAIAQARQEMNPMEDVFDLYQSLSQMSRSTLLGWANTVGLPKLQKKRERVKAIANRYGWDWVVKWSWRKFRFEAFRFLPVVVLRQGEERYTSDVCSYINKNLKPSLCACITSDGQWSLRSDRNGSNVDVGAIAKALGGGGHRNAAGFKP
jgi:oligoribonuclease NrnB/cAMP/cGMP phosphodiesterase (DHH superfamily)